MAEYEVRITREAAKELDALPRKKDRQAVIRRIQTLAGVPRPSGHIKLSGSKGLYRVRQGPYRIVYTIEDDQLVVIVIRIANRKSVYRKGHGKRSRQRTEPFDFRR